MKKVLFTCIMGVINISTLFSQSPVMTVPNGAFDMFTATPLPQPYGLAAGEIWYKGSSWDDAGGVDFRTPFPLSQYPADKIGFDGRNAEAAQNCIFDANGEMSYFILDGTIFNKDGKMVESLNGVDLYAEYQNNSSYVDINHPNPNLDEDWIKYDHSTVGGEFVVVPNPDNCDQYFIVFMVYTNSVFTNGRPRWVTFDVSVLNPITQNYGKVLNYNSMAVQTLDPVPNYITNSIDNFPFNDAPKLGALMKMGVTPITSSSNRFLYINDNEVIYKFIVDVNGVSWDNTSVGNSVYSTTPNYFIAFINSLPSSQNMNGVGELEIIPKLGGGFMLATIGSEVYNLGGGNFRGNVSILELDASGNYVPNSLKIAHTGVCNTLDESLIRGLEFSNNGQYLYVNKLVSSNNPNPIGYIDVTSATPTIIDLSLANDDAFQYSQIEMGIDGKIYFINQNNLATLDNTNNPTAIAASPSSYWSPTAVSLPNTYYPNPTAYITLPDQIDGENWQDRFTTNCCELMEREYEFTASTGTQYWSPGNNPFNPT